ncbi:MAG TPA: hypothetical protein VOA87_19165, partial [Thermoanaerobaculia bacterium]|nr:hypothetical protein [Thermoanaerobaculia bacterium]
GRSSGRFSSVLAALAAVTAVGEAAGLVDLGDHLDPAAAAAMGMDLQRLLWLRPRNLKQALAGAEMLIGGGFPLVVIELGSPPLAGGRGAEGAWVRLAHAAREQGTALLVGSPYRVSGTAAAAVLQAERTRFAWEGGGSSPRILDGLSARLVVEKRRGALPGQAEAFALHASTLPRRLAPERPAAPPRRQAPMTPMAPMAPIAAWEPRLAAVG